MHPMLAPPSTHRVLLAVAVSFTGISCTDSPYCLYQLTDTLIKLTICFLCHWRKSSLRPCQQVGAFESPARTQPMTLAHRDNQPTGNYHDLPPNTHQLTSFSIQALHLQFFIVDYWLNFSSYRNQCLPAS